MKINNEKDLLRFMMKNMDEQHRCSDKKLNIRQYLDVYTMCNYLDILKKSGYISVYLGGEFEIHDKAISYLRNTPSKIRKIMFLVLKWIIGIITAILTAYLIYTFGLN